MYSIFATCCCVRERRSSSAHYTLENLYRWLPIPSQAETPSELVIASVEDRLDHTWLCKGLPIQCFKVTSLKQCNDGCYLMSRQVMCALQQACMPDDTRKRCATSKIYLLTSKLQNEVCPTRTICNTIVGWSWRESPRLFVLSSCSNALRNDHAWSTDHAWRLPTEGCAAALAQIPLSDITFERTQETRLHLAWIQWGAKYHIGLLRGSLQLAWWTTKMWWYILVEYNCASQLCRCGQAYACFMKESKAAKLVSQ